MKWFKHYSNANRNKKLEKVLIKYGSDGYALYWLCLELITAAIDNENITFELEHDSEILAYRLKVDSSRVEEMMKYMINLELFEESNDHIFCFKLAEKLENSIVKNPQLKQIQDKIRDNRGLYGIIREESGQNKNKIENKIENKTKNLELDIERRHKRFTPPTFDELKLFITESVSVNGDKYTTIDPERFIDFYASKGWRVGNSPMKDWKSTARNWMRDEKKKAPPTRKEEEKEKWNKALNEYIEMGMSEEDAIRYIKGLGYVDPY